MNKTLASVSLFIITIFVCGCSKSNNTPANTANVTFVNGCAGTTGIDARVNNIAVSGAANIGFLGNSGYKAVTAGSATVAYFLTNVGTPVTSNTETLAGGNSYSAFSGGLLTAPTFLFVQDSLSTPAASSAKIRVVNLSSDALSLSATTELNTIFASGITSLHASSFYTLPAGSHEIIVGDSTNLNTAKSTGTVTLGAGKIYTIIYTGSLASVINTPSALKVTLLNNN